MTTLKEDFIQATFIYSCVEEEGSDVLTELLFYETGAVVLDYSLYRLVCPPALLHYHATVRAAGHTTPLVYSHWRAALCVPGHYMASHYPGLDKHLPV